MMATEAAREILSAAPITARSLVCTTMRRTTVVRDRALEDPEGHGQVQVNAKCVLRTYNKIIDIKRLRGVTIRILDRLGSVEQLQPLQRQLWPREEEEDPGVCGTPVWHNIPHPGQSKDSPGSQYYPYLIWMRTYACKLFFFLRGQQRQL